MLGGGGSSLFGSTSDYKKRKKGKKKEKKKKMLSPTPYLCPLLVLKDTCRTLSPRRYPFRL